MGRLTLGTAPDSWGVWFPEDPVQARYGTFLDEAAEAGFRWIELGAFGYLPTEPTVLRGELERRGLSVAGGTSFAALHRQSVDKAWGEIEPIAQLTAAMGAHHLVVIPSLWRDAASGQRFEDPELSDAEWGAMTRRHDELGQRLLDTYGLIQAVHPHADSHLRFDAEIDRFLEGTDPSLTNLCLDTGHVAYHAGDAVALMRRHPDRIRYMHVKQVNPTAAATAVKDDTWFTTAVAEGVVVEPPRGEPAFDEIVDVALSLPQPLFLISEHDLYPAKPGNALPLARRTFAYLSTLVSARVIATSLRL